LKRKEKKKNPTTVEMEMEINITVYTVRREGVDRFMDRLGWE
jgi:TFIIF-interacting CTD phosphatase-like protein